MSETLDRRRDAIVVVDLQPDFMPGGALAVPGGDEVVRPIAALIEGRHVQTVVATQDWHPAGHVSFASSHEGKEPFDRIALHGREQVLWPDHCVQGTPGAVLHAELPLAPVLAFVRKGEDPGIDSYSALWNNYGPGGERRPTGLGGYLQARGIQRLVICGLALDYCVAWTARDAVAMGFDVVVPRDLSRAVDPGRRDETIDELRGEGVVVTTASELGLALS